MLRQPDPTSRYGGTGWRKNTAAAAPGLRRAATPAGCAILPRDDPGNRKHADRAGRLTSPPAPRSHVTPMGSTTHVVFALQNCPRQESTGAKENS